MDYFLPETTVEFFSCGAGAASCSELSLSSFATALGIPVASFGFFFYLWVFLSLHLFREAGDNYWHTCIYLLLPVSMLALCANIIFSVVLFFNQVTCTLCIATMAVTALILLISYVEYRKVHAATGITFFTALSILPRLVSDRKDRVFSTGTALYYTVILFLFVITFSMFLGEKYSSVRNSTEKRISYMEKYRNIPQKEFDLPETPFVTGAEKAQLTITVFTDPLCGACKTFHRIEQKLLKTFHGKIQIHSYYFPAMSCDSQSPSAPCRSTLLMFAAKRADAYQEVTVNHFDRYDTMRSLYANDAPYSEIIAELTANEEKRDKIEQYVTEEKTFSMMREHIELANKLHFSATPTLIINGRVLEGFPKREYMEDIIRYELLSAQ